jgi:hypothetical protein
MFSEDEKKELRERFDELDENKNGLLSLDEIDKGLKDVQLIVPKHELRQLIFDFDKNNDGYLNFEEYCELCSNIKEKKIGHLNVVKGLSGLNIVESTRPQSAAGTTHSFSEEEKYAFTDWINHILGNDPDLKSQLPINVEGMELFKACNSGLLIAKLINSAVPETIDERALNKKNLNVFKIHENQTLCLNSAKAIGCSITNIGAQDIIDGIPHLCLGMIWQVIRIGLLAHINLKECSGLALLLEEGETLQDLLALPAEQLLIRWVNYHLKQAGTNRTISNFSGDIKDSECYTILLKQIAPQELGIDTSPLRETDHLKRAEAMLDNAEKMKCRRFVRPTDVVKGNPKLNLAFVANLFNTYPALNPVEVTVIEETREEKTYRNWMNSLGVSPYVNNLYQDLRDGLVILQLFDHVYTGLVDWKRVNQPPYKENWAVMKKTENCNYAVDLGKEKKYSLVGVGGKDLVDGGKTHTLSLIWQLMRAYTLEVLKKLSGSEKPITDGDILRWVNETLTAHGKSSQIKSFKDPSLADSMTVVDLVESIKPGSVDYQILKPKATGHGDRMSNAKYAVSMARKIGARVYALPEDLVEVNPKMVMTIFACLMSCSYQK